MVWNSHVHRDFPGKFESMNLSRHNLSREIWRKEWLRVSELRVVCRVSLSLFAYGGNGDMDDIVHGGQRGFREISWWIGRELKGSDEGL